MKFIVRLLCVSTIAFGIASAASPHKLKLTTAATVGTVELKAGDYTVEMQGDKVVFKSGKQTVEVPATVEKSDKKFSLTTYTSLNSKIKEINLGGTSDKIVLTAVSPSSSGTK